MITEGIKMAIIALHSEGLSRREIQQRMKKLFNAELCVQTIQNVVKNHVDARGRAKGLSSPPPTKKPKPWLKKIDDKTAKKMIKFIVKKRGTRYFLIKTIVFFNDLQHISHHQVSN